MRDKKLEAAALWYAQHHWPVVALHNIRDGVCTCGRPRCSSPGKHPRTRHGLKDARINDGDLVSWWTRWPDANIGVSTGRIAGIVAVDVDPRHGGDESLAELIRQHGEPPATVEALTGGGGRHLIFKHPGVEIRNRANVLPGIDLRGDGGYIVVAPSVHVSGGVYSWRPGHAPEEIEPAPLPDWLRELLTAPERKPSEHEPAPEREELARLLAAATQYMMNAAAASEGNRNNSAFSLAGHLFAFEVDRSGLRLTEPQVLDLMRTWNHRNAPPLSEAELVTVVSSAARNGKPRAAHEVTLGKASCSEAVPTVAAPDEECGPVLVCMGDVEPREVQWLWPGRLPLGRITLLVGRPGEGKSFLTTDMASRVTTGKHWPDGTPCPSGSVILVCAEDDPGDTIRPRLDAHGADVRRVHLLSAVRRISDDGEPYEVLFTLADVFALEAALQAHPDCKLIVVDPIGSFLGGDTDAHRDNEVRSVLAPVARLAEKYEAAVLVVAHRRKSAGSIADDLALGSRAFTGIARAVWHLTRDNEDKARRLLLPGKNNLAPEGNGLAFRISGEPAAVAWEPGSVTMSADDALAVENRAGRDDKPGPEPEARNAAADWLRELLRSGPMPAANVKDEAKAAEFGWRTVQRAAESIGVQRHKCSFGGGWTWELSAQDDNRRCQGREEPNNLASWHLRENRPENVDSEPGNLEDAKLDHLGVLADTPSERQPDRPPPEGIPAKVWATIQARKAAAPRERGELQPIA